MEVSDTPATLTPSLKGQGFLLGGLWLVALIFYLPTTLHPDVSWYLVATDRFLDGAVLYRDIIEVNPPLGFYLTVPPVFAARLFGTAAEPVFTTYVFLLIALSLALTCIILKRIPDVPAPIRHGLAFAGLGALVLLPMPVFGEREHLMAILSLPYVFLCVLRSYPQRFSVPLSSLVGVLGAFGFGLKPYFLAVPLLLELYLVFVHRSLATVRRPELCGLAIGLIAYLSAVLGFYPDYFTFMVPIGVLVYDAYSAPFLEVVTRQPPLLSLATILYLLARRARMVDRMTDVFGIATIGFLICYLIQSKGWFYHILPAMIMAWLAIAAILLRCWKPIPSSPSRQRTLLAALAVGAMALILTPSLSNGPYRSAFSDTLLPYVQKYAAGGSVYAFTAHVWVAFPLVNEAKVEWASRFPTQWLLPGALRTLSNGTTLNPKTEQGLRQVEAYARGAVIEDLAAVPPDLVIVDKDNPYFGEENFDYLAYFRQDPRFAEFWRSYVKVKEVKFIVKSEMRIFEIWCRQYQSHSCDA